MLGLFIKDLKLLKAQKKLFMLVGIVTAVVLFNIQDGTEMIGFMAGYMVFVVTMAATSTIGCDEADHGTVFLFTLPVSRKEYVLEKYGLAVAGSAAAVCVVTVLVYLVSVVRGSQLMAEQLFIILIMMPLALILFSSAAFTASGNMFWQIIADKKMGGSSHRYISDFLSRGVSCLILAFLSAVLDAALWGVFAGNFNF